MNNTNPYPCGRISRRRFLHQAVLQQLGLDYKKMELEVVGRTMKLVEEGDGPIKEILL